MGNPNNTRREKQYWEKAFQWKSNDPRLSETYAPDDMQNLDMQMRSKIKDLAVKQQPACKGLPELMKSKEDAWWNAERQILPARQLLALYYENFRIEAPALDTMSMADLAAINFLNYGDKGLELFWEEWKRVAMGVSHCVTHPTIIKLLMDQLTNSKVLADEIKEIKKRPFDTWDYDEIAKVVTNKIEERAVKERTRLQLADHQEQLLKTYQNGKKGPGGGQRTAKTTDDGKKDPPAPLTA
jgi:hypothetical protein